MATIRGKQKSVQEGSFLQFLRSVGYREDLPPSTVAWLDSAPVFKFLASKLTHDNFITLEEQQEYNEIMLARGPHAELYDALGDASSDAEIDSDVDNEASDSQIAGKQDWMGMQNDSSVSQAVQAKEAEIQHLQEQVAELRALSAQLDGSVQQQRSSQATYLSAQSHSVQQLSLAQADAAQQNAAMNGVLQELSAVCTELADLMQECPQQWLLSAMDFTCYAAEDEAVRQLFDRAMKMLNAAVVVRQLDSTAPTPLHPTLAKVAGPAAAAALHSRPCAAGQHGIGHVPSSVITPRQHKQVQLQQQQHMNLMTPRRRGDTNRATALQEADIRRHADQEACNAALMRELTRQRLAFKLALDDLVRCEMASAGLQGQVAAAKAVKAGTGSFERHRKMGPAAVELLSAQLLELEGVRQQLGGEEIPALTEDLARLNDTHILAGDYERQLVKMSIARARKHAVLRALLDVKSRHLLLLMLGKQEVERLEGLQQQLSTAVEQLEHQVDTTSTRLSRYLALTQQVQQLQQCSNTKPGDSYLLAVLAAAGGAVDQAANDIANGAHGNLESQPIEPSTPLLMSSEQHVSQQSANTPPYLPVESITNQLQGLSSKSFDGTTSLLEVLHELPQQLEQIKGSARQLHLMAYPAWQQQQQQQQQITSTAARSESCSSYAASLASASAASKRSTGSTGTGNSAAVLLQQHAAPGLRPPEVAEAHQALDASCKKLSKEIRALSNKHNDAIRLINSGQAENDFERDVMALFFNKPSDLAARVSCLTDEVTVLEQTS